MEKMLDIQKKMKSKHSNTNTATPSCARCSRRVGPRAGNKKGTEEEKEIGGKKAIGEAKVRGRTPEKENRQAKVRIQTKTTFAIIVRKRATSLQNAVTG